MAKSPRSRSRSRGSLRRRVAVQSPKRTVLVFCEGRRTEPDYLRALKQQPEVRDVASVDIQISQKTTGSVPLTLVKAAAEARERSFDEKGEVDEVWCLFDIEWPKNHPNLPEALNLAKARDIRIAYSNPCFELWLALHFSDQTAWIDTNAATGLRRSHDGSSDKGVDSGKYMPRRADAARRARLLEEKHLGDGTNFPRDNPSSGMHKFLDAIERPPLKLPLEFQTGIVTVEMCKVSGGERRHPFVCYQVHRPASTLACLQPSACFKLTHHLSAGSLSGCGTACLQVRVLPGPRSARVKATL